MNDEQITELIAEATAETRTVRFGARQSGKVVLGSHLHLVHRLADALTQVKAERDALQRQKELDYKAMSAQTGDMLEQLAARDAVIAEVLEPRNIDYGRIDVAINRVRNTLSRAPESVLAERDAEKWDEGYRAGYVGGGLWIDDRDTVPNPYRQGGRSMTEHPCGDYPAPCNCDDPETHDRQEAGA